MASIAVPTGSCGCVSIPSNATGILTHFGEFSKLLVGGLSCYCCCSDNVVLVFNNVKQWKVNTSTITRDNVNVRIETDIIYHIARADSWKAYSTLANAEAHFASLVENSIRAHATTHAWGELYSKRDELSDLVRGNLLKEASDRGFTIERVVVVGVHLPPDLTAAMNTKATNEQLRFAAVDRAEAERLTTVANARAEAERAMLLAEAKAQQMRLAAAAQADVDRLKGKGIADQRLEIARGIEQAATTLGEKMKMDPAEASQLVFTAQYLETLREMGANDRATVLFPYAASVGDIPRAIMQGMSLAGEHQAKKSA